MSRYDDVSSRLEYAGLVNKTFRSREVMLIHGVTLDANYRQVVDIYTLTPQPGMWIGSPEILSIDTLLAGTTLRVKRVLECTNCPFSDGNQLEVELPTLPKYASHATRLGFYFMRPIVLRKDGKAMLDSTLFESVPP